MNVLQMLLLALILDAIFGEPEWLWRRYPHPVTLFGRLINWFDEKWNKGGMRREKGMIALAFLAIGALAVGYLIRWLPDFGILEVFVAAVLLAHNSLTRHVQDVAFGLRQGLNEGRANVAMIVGRDTGGLDESAVARSAIESAAENFSDAVIAPAFWFLLLGLPGLLFYKLVNTADSMIGHRNDTYRDFGFGAAKLDDLINWIPARITGALICLTHLSRNAWDVMMQDADLHRSPNAGWPEAAMAGVLDISLAGPRSYDGLTTEDPFINGPGRRQLTPDDVENAVAVINRGWLMVVGLLLLALIPAWLF
jgi:adenosylcobinamide-phosphate synthase